MAGEDLPRVSKADQHDHQREDGATNATAGSSGFGSGLVIMIAARTYAALAKEMAFANLPRSKAPNGPKRCTNGKQP